jgi:hypothetical protein
VLQTDKRDRHLLLFVRPTDGKAARFLCGHDEREWFVAAVPGGASSVVQAKEALKPLPIRARQSQLEVPTRLRNRRKNAAFRRQGEWFFVPASAWRRDPVNEKYVLSNEPLRRGAGKAHIVEQLYRVAGELVYVCPKYPNGVSATSRLSINHQPITLGGVLINASQFTLPSCRSKVERHRAKVGGRKCNSCRGRHFAPVPPAATGRVS